MLRQSMPEGWSLKQIQDGRQSILVLKREAKLAKGEYRLLAVPCVSPFHGQPPITLTVRLYEVPFLSQQGWSDARAKGSKATRLIPDLLKQLSEVPVAPEPKPRPREYAKYKPRTEEEERLVADLRNLVAERDRSRGLPQFWYGGSAFWSIVVALDKGNSHLPLGRAIVLESSSLEAELHKVQFVLATKLETYSGER